MMFLTAELKTDTTKGGQGDGTCWQRAAIKA